MSKRLQVLLPAAEFAELKRHAKRLKKNVAEVVRESLRATVLEPPPADPEKKLAALLRFARFSGPTGDIEQLLDEIEQGRE